MSFEELAARQAELGKDIGNELVNHKREPSRWTISKTERRVATIEEYWREFQDNHQKLAAEAENYKEHPYFLEKYATKIKVIFENCKEELLSNISTLKKQAPGSTTADVPPFGQGLKSAENVSKAGLEDTNEQNPANAAKVIAENSKIRESKQTTAEDFQIPFKFEGTVDIELYKRQRIRRTMMHNLAETIQATETHTISFLKYKLEYLNREWQRVVETHEEICATASTQDFKNYYFENQVFETADQEHDELVQYILQRISDLQPGIQPAHGSEPSHMADIRVPALELPKFNGNAIAWPAFQEAFTRIIARKRITAAEKLIYLQSCLVGNAATTIKHLALTDSNYEIAWKLIVEKYNNPRALVETLIERLMTQPSTGNDVAKGLRRIHDTTRECMFALIMENINIESWDSVICYILRTKLDHDTTSAYELSLKNPKQLQKAEDLLKFIDHRCQTLESLRSKPDIGRNNGNPRAHAVTSQAQQCIMCPKNHELYHCDKFKELPIKKRCEFVQTNSICKQCLTKHSSECRATKFICRKCDEGHHRLLHAEKKTGSSNPSHGKSQKATSAGSHTVVTGSEAELEAVNLHVDSPGNTLLATAIVMVKNNCGMLQPFRALIDQGSQVSIITSQALKTLQLSKYKATATISGIGGSNNQVLGQSELNIKPRFKSDFTVKINAFVLNNITKMLPGFDVKTADNGSLNSLVLADPEFFQSKKIDLILGADVYEEILLPGLLKPSGNPMAQQTELGWILSGKSLQNGSSTELKCMVSNIELDKQLAKFWEIEETSTVRQLTEEEELCEKHFADTHERQPDGKYVVRLPLKESSDVLGNSYKMALVRFHSMERSLAKRPEIRVQYEAFMDEYENLGHMEPAECPKPGETVYYLPHHAILRPSSTTTKLRVVFDASAKTDRKISLNDIQRIGPKLQQDLAAIIMRWRTHRIVFTADIAKMYRQIGVHQMDQNLQRILWRKNPTDKIKEYKLKTITYGTSSAPYLAIRTLKQLAMDEQERFKIGSKILLRDFYVDDLMSGANSVPEALLAQNEIRQILSSGGLPIRKWTSNSEEILLNVPEQDREISLPLHINMDSTVKTLGLHWNPVEDEFKYNVNLEQTSAYTKRQLVSEIAKIFDPIGWLAPIVVTSKILYQKLWLIGLDWDDQLPGSVAKEWEKYREHLPEVEKIRIPRWIGLNTNDNNIEIHGFCDASIHAYAAVIYVRVYSNGRFSTKLLTSKTRVAPTRQISLPRLELSGALLLAKLLQTVKMALELPDDKLWAWSDSTITLGWIKGHPSRWKTFVANRVTQIQTSLDPSKWKYVNTKDNPADIASRGCQPHELRDHQLWWNGPQWLNLHHDNWPTQPPAMDHFSDELKNISEDFKTEVTKEMKQEKHFVAVGVAETRLEIENYSSLTRLKRVTAWVFRFTNNCHGTTQKGPLTTMELSHAERFWIIKTQQQSFPNEYENLTNKKPIAQKSRLLSLNPFFRDGIIRVGGRLKNSKISYDRQHQVILPANSHLTKLIILDAHFKTMHGGVQLTMANTRLKYWIMSGKNIIRWTIHKCVTCFRYTATSSQQLMGDLPEPRVTMARPFKNSGVDFAGPLTIKFSVGRGSRTTKAYVALFICFSTKAIHLDAVSDLSTSAFLAAFRRFCGRRGICTNIYSDCGTNFVGASKKLQNGGNEWAKHLNGEMRDTLSTAGTQWHFIPPGSPHFGGLWEAGVKSMKHHFKRISNHNLTFEELSTILCQIESCLNSRPLYPMSNDPDDIMALTPGHFLIGEPLLAVPEGNLMETPVHQLHKWRKLQGIYQEFWKHWNAEYLTRLQQRPKWKKEIKNVEPGNLVLIRDEQLPPSKWLLGRIMETQPGRDGFTRVVTIKTKNTILKRPITKVCPLPIDDNDRPAVIKNTIKPPESVRVTRQSTRKNLSHMVSILSMLICICIRLPLHATNYLQGMSLQPLNNTSGMYFEDIGVTNVISGTWQLVVYYDLKNYWTEQAAFPEYLKQLYDGCTKGTYFQTYGDRKPEILSEFDRTICLTIHSQLEKMISEITSKNELLYHGNRKATPYRQKRGLINAIGSMQHTLFGVLDEEFAKEYERQILTLNTNSDHMLKLISKQTLIADATTNIIKKEKKDIDLQLELFKNQLTAMNENTHASHLFITAALRILIQLTTYQLTQNALLGLVLDTQNGKLNPLLLTPNQFVEQITFIQGHISPTMRIPGYDSRSDLAILYKIISTKARVMENMIIIEIGIPLVTREQFQIFHILPLPTLHKRISIIPTTPYLAITLDRNKYWLINDGEINSCILLQERKYICNTRTTMYTSNSGVARCEVSLLLHKEELDSSCKIKLATPKKEITWIPLRAKNNWIIQSSSPQIFDVICGDKLTELHINGTAILKIFQRCKIRHAATIISAHEIINSNTSTSFMPRANLNLALQEIHQHDKKMPSHSSTELELENLSKFINKQKKMEMDIPTNTNSTDMHQFGIIYGLLIVVIGMIIVWINQKTSMFKLCFCKTKKKTKKTKIEQESNMWKIQTPVPHPRTKPEPELEMVSIQLN